MEEFNEILNASLRTKIPPSDKVIPHDQMHWLKTLIFTHLPFIKAVASDQHNYANNIKMIKVVHQSTLCPNTLIYLIDHFTTGWTHARIQDFCQEKGGPGPTARIQDPHMGPIHTCVRMHARTHTRTHTHTHVCTDRHMNVHAQADE